MFKRITVLAALAAAVATVPVHAGEGDFTVTGTIAAPAPESRVVGGVTEIGSPCLSDPDLGDSLQGVDGYWIQLPEVFDGMRATLTGNIPSDLDAWFYGAGCSLILEPVETAYSMAGNPHPTGLPAPAPASSRMVPDGDELNGVIPEGTEWVMVDLYAGAGVTFTFTVDSVTDEPAA